MYDIYVRIPLRIALHILREGKDALEVIHWRSWVKDGWLSEECELFVFG